MKIHKGGRVIGEGTYGKILAEPRMPCDNETYEMIKDKKEISKIFKDYRDIMTYDKTKLLLDSKFSSDKDKEKLEKSFIVPEVCNINDAEVLKYSDIYTKEWLGKSAQDNGNIEDFIDEYNAQTVSEMGIMDLHTGIYTKTQFSRDIPSILQSIQKAQNIFEGIRLLERKGMFHGDIKNANYRNSRRSIWLW